MPDIDRVIDVLWNAANIWEDDPTSEQVYDLILEAIGLLEGIEPDEEENEPIA